MFDQIVASLMGPGPRRHGEIREGDIFTRLTATDKTKINPRGGGRLRWCVCECGKEGWYRESQMKSGNSKSCGCYRRDRALQMLEVAREAASKKVVRGVDGKFQKQDN